MPAMNHPRASSTPPVALSRDVGLFERVGEVGAASERAGVGLGVVVALLLHGAATFFGATSLIDMRLFAERVRQEVIDELTTSYQVELEEPDATEIEKPEPELDEPEPEPLAPIETPPDAQVPPPAEAVSDAEPAPPAAAEAGEVLTSEPDPAEPLDLTDQSFISGSGTRFAGGVTAGAGTSKKAVRHATARADGVVGSRGKSEGTGTPAPVDRSKPAGLVSGVGWSDCGFPPEADAEQINQAAVQIVVAVSPDGSPQSVSVVQDPGYGFGRVAKRCAMRKRFEPGLDKWGRPSTRSTPPFNVRFTR